MRELEAMRRLISDLDALWKASADGTVPAEDVAAIFEQHTSLLPAGSQVLAQFERLASMLRQGPARTRVEGIRQITRKLQRQADDFARVVEARDAKLRGR
jgi:predicted lipoprotein